ncbi:hypothetical protein EV421DRAFT_1989340 [Armillaria borealis]|uniref:Uncharacterized protein n=1 Tax=Armillaria borealis TaxID=47425 RepID=A0AA39J5I2_9AGAR|nr:hypothetical protein EV421DRAFT_1989340 [Armillaria borealis]
MAENMRDLLGRGLGAIPSDDEDEERSDTEGEVQQEDEGRMTELVPQSRERRRTAAGDILDRYSDWFPWHTSHSILGLYIPLTLPFCSVLLFRELGSSKNHPGKVIKCLRIHSSFDPPYEKHRHLWHRVVRRRRAIWLIPQRRALFDVSAVHRILLLSYVRAERQVVDIIPHIIAKSPGLFCLRLVSTEWVANLHSILDLFPALPPAFRCSVEQLTVEETFALPQPDIAPVIPHVSLGPNPEPRGIT